MVNSISDELCIDSLNISAFKAINPDADVSTVSTSSSIANVLLKVDRQRNYRHMPYIHSVNILGI